MCVCGKEKMYFISVLNYKHENLSILSYFKPKMNLLEGYWVGHRAVGRWEKLTQKWKRKQERMHGGQVPRPLLANTGAHPVTRVGPWRPLPPSHQGGFCNCSCFL